MDTTNPTTTNTPSNKSATWRIFIGVAVLVTLLRAFVLSPFWVPSGSMEPTFAPNSLIVATKGEVKRGEIVVFKAPHWGGKTAYTKRVIAVGGDTVGGCDRGNRLMVNGEGMVEDYVAHGESGCNFDPVTVPEGRLWVMGDNRGDSADSRYHTLVSGSAHGGTIAEEDVKGVVHVTLWPPSRV